CVTRCQSLFPESFSKDYWPRLDRCRAPALQTSYVSLLWISDHRPSAQTAHTRFSSAKSIRAGSPRRRLSRALAPYPHRARRMNKAVLKHNGRFFRDREIRWQRMLVKCAQSLETAMNACGCESAKWADRPM